MLYSERQRLAAITAREAAGDSLWTPDIPRVAKKKIANAWQLLTDQDDHNVPRLGPRVLALISHNLGTIPVRYPQDLAGAEDDLIFLTYVEALCVALGSISNYDSTWDPGPFRDRVNEVFNSYRVSYRLVGSEVVPFASDELHVEVVEPALRLLAGREDFAPALATYTKALKEISNNDPGDAITDAGSALQEALVALGCQGNALGRLIMDAKQKGLLASHDQTLTDGIVKFLDWASADRSQTGDAHSNSHAALGDAWLMVHVVGALVLRLADGEPRAS